MSKAKRCTILEVHALNYWRSRGVMIKAGDPIPLVEQIKPFPKRRPFLYVLGCTSIIAVTLCLFGAWLFKAAGIY